MKSFIKIILLSFTIVSILACENLREEKPLLKKHVIKLKLLHKYKLKIPEPSGLSLSSDKNSLWVVSDNNSRVYQISLKGKIKRSFKIMKNNLEGITVVNDSLLAVVSEKSNTIL